MTITHSWLGQALSKPIESFVGDTSKVQMQGFEYKNPISPTTSFKIYFNKIHKKYPELNTTNIENLIDKVLYEKDQTFLNFVREETNLKNNFLNRFFGIKTSLGNVLEEVQNSQESPNRKLLENEMFINAESEAKKLMKKFSIIENEIHLKRLSNITKVGSEFQVNTYTANDQMYSSVATLANGNFVVTWTSFGQDSDGFGIYAQVFNPDGTKNGSEFRVNTYVTSTQMYSSVAALTNGNFVITWTSAGQDSSGYGIYAQVFNPVGTKNGSEFRVNTYVTSDQSQSSIIALTNGNFVITWQSNTQDGDGFGVYAQVFNPVGTKNGSEFQVNTYTTNYQMYPTIAALANGNFVITWTSNGQDGDGDGIYAQVFNPDGTKNGSEFQVNTYTTSNQIYPSVATLANGNFVITWTSAGQDGDGDGIYAQVFNPDGTKNGSEFQVNTYTTNAQSYPKVGVLTNGNFIIAWTSTGQDGNLGGIYAQVFNSDGIKNGYEFQVNTYTTNSQSSSSVSALTNNMFVITWDSRGQDGSMTGVYAQLFNYVNISTSSTSSTHSTSSTSTSSSNSFPSTTDSSSTSSTSSTYLPTSVSSSSSNSFFSTSDFSSTSLPNSFPNFSVHSSKNKPPRVTTILGIVLPILSCFAASMIAIFYFSKKRKVSRDHNPTFSKDRENEESGKYFSYIGGDESQRSYTTPSILFPKTEGPFSFDSSSRFELESVVKRPHKEIGKKYYQLGTIYEEEIKEIYDQAGLLITLPTGEKKIKFKIGEGHFGVIKIAKHIESGEYVISKKIKGEDKIKASETEANLQKEAAGENILPIYNTIKLENALYHFMPFAGLGDGESIQRKLSMINDPKLAEDILTFIAQDILTGLKTIHEKGIYHLDMKPDNLLFSKNGTGYITDFGCAKKSFTSQMAPTIGDVRYYSPDRLQAIKNNTFFDAEKEDIWALGVSLLQMYKNIYPLEFFEQSSNFQNRVMNCDHSFFYEKLKFIKELQDPKEESVFWIIEKLLDLNFKTRFTATQALQATCFKNLKALSKEKIFEDMQRHVLIQQTKSPEVTISSYSSLSQLLKDKPNDFYLSANNSNFYEDFEKYFLFKKFSQ